MNKSITVGFIGCGNMGGALARAAAKSGAGLLLADKDSMKASALAGEIGARASSNEEIATSADFIFLGVKPNLLKNLLAELSGHLISNPDATLVSMAAGITTQSIRTFIGECKNRIIRIMPNTPVAVGSGVIAYCGDDGECREQLSDILTAAGRLMPIDEKLIDAECALAGCGPAFVYMFADALARGGELCGLSREDALIYSAATLEGAARMILESGEEPDVLKERVCSPGGATIEGVKVLEERELFATVNAAVRAAYEKTKILGKAVK